MFLKIKILFCDFISDGSHLNRHNGNKYVVGSEDNF